MRYTDDVSIKLVEVKEKEQEKGPFIKSIQYLHAKL